MRGRPGSARREHHGPAGPGSRARGVNGASGVPLRLVPIRLGEATGRDGADTADFWRSQCQLAALAVAVGDSGSAGRDEDGCRGTIVL